MDLGALAEIRGVFISQYEVKERMLWDWTDLGGVLTWPLTGSGSVGLLLSFFVVLYGIIISFNKFIQSGYLLNACSVQGPAAPCLSVCLEQAQCVPLWSVLHASVLFPGIVHICPLPLDLYRISCPLSRASTTARSCLSGTNWCAD